MIELTLAIFIGMTAHGVAMLGVTHLYLGYTERKVKREREEYVKRESANLLAALREAGQTRPATGSLFDLVGGTKKHTKKPTDLS